MSLKVSFQTFILAVPLEFSKHIFDRVTNVFSIMLAVCLLCHDGSTNFCPMHQSSNVGLTIWVANSHLNPRCIIYRRGSVVICGAALTAITG